MKKIRTYITALTVLSIFAGGLLFIFSHGTCLGYNDWLVVGKTYEEVEERYGDFDREYGHKKGYYIGRDQSIFLSNNLPLYYWMVCDDSGVVTDVYVGTRPGA